ncbi:hypothetical protein F4680DRAFT_448536 [Xylaria scruposa]|nr:hypothetical protein F4680DRAFT_448536 [Xylaria scruposa]
MKIAPERVVSAPVIIENLGLILGTRKVLVGTLGSNPSLLHHSSLLNFGQLLQQYLRHPSERECTHLLNSYSPAIDANIVEYYETNFQNEFGSRSEYIGLPTPGLEGRWNDLWSRGTIELPLDGPSRLNKSSERLNHVHEDPKRGYLAILEVFHQLHCLVSEDTRGIVDLNVTDPANIADRMHADHCIEALRLQLICNVDLTLLLIELDESNDFGQKADFNVHHKRRNWDKITEWQYANSIEREDK